MKKQYAVFGLGQFGGSLVKSFAKLGEDVMAIDANPNKVKEYSKIATHAVHANGVDEDSLIEIGIRNFDHAFVSFGENIESSILTSLLLKDLGVPRVWSKAQNEYHHKVLSKIGVDRVIHPEREMAKRIAHHTVSDNIIDYVELSEDYSMVEIVATQKLHNKSLAELSVREKYGCTIVGIQRDKKMLVSPDAEEKVLKDDILIVMGHNADIHRFEKVGV
ncbi:trk system potassium uptake protein TrkA [Gracilibacillus orientalis]|uniref:Trk system potassium uptake protein TrkA n=1 Tax=Gracilibacillus orientalis TaxID=334253 RepID=A0A1I4HAN0_9BACI|nr:TrkA family potassium uptake protein [Gracilibacillus orientalis]SFL38506.1 trk system potassium uptake protein TrkA [Gracilibacillus orientalis]